MIPEPTKYVELKERGSSASQVSVVAREDGLGSIETLYVLKHVFDLSLGQAKETWINMEGNEYISNLEQIIQAELDQIQNEDALEKQGGIS